MKYKKYKISDIADVNPPKEIGGFNDETEVSFIPMNMIDEVLGVVKEDTIRTLREVRSGYTSFIDNDVLFAKITPCMENGNCVVVKNLKNGIGFGSTEFYVLRAKDNIDNRFLWHFLRRESFRKEAKKHLRGAVGHKRVPKKFLLNTEIQIPVKSGKPDLEKQRAIVAELDKKDLIVNNINKNMVNNEINLFNYINSIVRSIGKKDGFDNLPLSQVVNSKSGNSNLIKGKQIQKEEDGLYPAYSASGQDIWRKEYEHQGEAIILSAVGARCGKCFKASGKWSSVANTHIITVNEGYSRDYVWYLLNNEDFWVKGGAAQPFVKVSDTLNKKSIPIPIDRFGNPDHQRQRLLAEKLNEIINKKDAILNKNNLTKRLIKNLSESFTNKVAGF